MPPSSDAFCGRSFFSIRHIFVRRREFPDAIGRLPRWAGDTGLDKCADCPVDIDALTVLGPDVVRRWPRLAWSAAAGCAAAGSSLGARGGSG